MEPLPPSLDLSSTETAPALEQWWQDFVGSRDHALRNQLVEFYLPLARRTAASLFARRVGTDTEFVDFLQLATLGLIEAVDRFDPARGVVFPAYAMARIRGAVLNGLPEISERYQQSTLRKRLRMERLGSLKEGAGSGKVRGNALAELAETAVVLALSFALEGSGILVEEESSRSYVMEFYDDRARRELQERFSRLVLALPPGHRRVIRYHYYQGLGFTEIAELLALSKGRVSQIHRQALLLLRESHQGAGDFDVRY